MKLVVVAVGQRLPPWAQAAVDDYSKRFPPELRLELVPVKAEARTAGRTRAQTLEHERERLSDAVSRHAGKGARVVMLDERGTALNTLQLAGRLTRWRESSEDVAFVMGGPDGIEPHWRDSPAHERIRLSDLTLPHALARVLLVEQLYRAWSIGAKHPYHRE